MTNPLTDLRHVDVAILYGQGQTDRAHHAAKKLYRARKRAKRLTEFDFSTNTTKREYTRSGEPLNATGNAIHE